MKILYLFLLLFLFSCGKVEHKVTQPEPAKVQADFNIPTEYGFAVYVALKKMYEDWIYICQDNYAISSIEYQECKEKAVDNLLFLVDDLEKTK